MNKDVNEALYKKILMLMALDTGFEVDFFYRYVDQSILDELLKKANVTEVDPDYIKGILTQLMDELIAELQQED